MKTSDKIINQYLLAIDGVNQLERSVPALDAAAVKIDGRSKQDMLRFLYALGAQIKFYDLNNFSQGNWQPFLDLLRPGGNIPDDVQLNKILSSREDWPPHIALLLSFLHIFSYVQKDLNLLPLKRLNFYYEDVLKLKRRAAFTDQVHVLFELSKNAPPTLLVQGTQLKAGNTDDGFPLNYSLESDYVITHAKINKIMSSFADRNNSAQQILFKTDDATLIRSSEISWRPFGAEQLEKSGVLPPMQPTTLGFAIASPSLFLAEGTRIITITLQLKSPVAAKGMILKNTLDIKLTSAEGWLVPDAVLNATLTPSPADLPDQREFNSTLAISILFNESAPAIVAFNAGIHKLFLETIWPVLSITLKPEAYLIEVLGKFTVQQVTIEVDVKGVRNLVLQNDQSIQAPGTPSLPFTSMPRIGSNFYIGSTEAFSKSVTSLAVTLQWQDPPADFVSYYSGYENPNINYLVFQSDLFFLSGKKWIQLSDSKYPLFDGSDTAAPKVMPVDKAIFTEKIAGSSFKRQPDKSPPVSFNQNVQQGFIKIMLTNPAMADVGNLPAEAPFEAFGHKSFSTVYTKQAIDKGLGLPNIVLPQQPYTPALSSVAVDYTASDTLRLDTPNYIDQFFLLDIFGAVESDKVGVVRLIPSHAQQGALYIGLENAAPSQLLSILFQLEEGSTPSPELLKSEDIVWSYLADGEWRQIARPDILEDKTNGLQVPGLVRLIMGADATKTHTLMPSDLYWLRAAVVTNADGAASIEALHTQAARATLLIGEELEEKYNAHLSSSLAAGKITAMAKKLAAVKKITQPYSSFGGLSAESDQSYHQRVHERIRHRDRGVTAWDYERLLLETFPSIFKVKCLPHTNTDNELSPGNVKLVIVPDWRKRATGNPLMPKANGAFLRTMEEFIEGKLTSVFSNVIVTNPVYETLLVDSKVIFMAGFDPGYHSLELEKEIKKFLSPWAYEEGEDIVFDGKISASEILAFIEGRIYVDHVTDFELYHRHQGKPGGGIGEMQIGIDFIIGITPDPSIGPAGIGKTIGEDFIIGVPVETAASTRPDAILVSNNHHRIGVLPAESKVCVGVQTIGIGEMIIGLDFIVIT